MTAPFSSAAAAQAVLDAVCKNTESDCDTQHIIAAGLRAAANQVVPKTEPIDKEEWIGQSAWKLAEVGVWFRILAIAAELESR